MNYMDGDTERELLEALRQGKPLATLAGEVGWNTEDLAKHLRLPSLQPAAAADQDQDFDLFATGRLDGVL